MTLRKRDRWVATETHAAGPNTLTTDGIIFVQSPPIPERLDSSTRDSEFPFKYSDSLNSQTQSPDIPEAPPVLEYSSRTGRTRFVSPPDSQSVILNEKQADGLDTNHFDWNNAPPVSAGWKQAEDV